MTEIFNYIYFEKNSYVVRIGTYIIMPDILVLIFLFSILSFSGHLYRIID